MAIDSAVGLIYSLSADVSQAESEIKKFDAATEKVGAKGKTSLDSLTDSVSSSGAGFLAMVNPVTLAVTSITAIATATVAASVALFNLAKETSDFIGDISDASQKTGLMVETISALRFGAEAFGSSFEEISGGITKFTKLVGEAARGSDEAKAKLKSLGIDPQDAVNDLEGAFSKAVKRIYELPPGAQQANAAMDAFGKTGASLIPFINSFDGDTKKLIQTAKDLGVVLTDEDARAADEFGDMLAVVSAQSKGAANQFALGFMPAITKAMSEISGSLGTNKNVWRDWGEFIGRQISNLIRGTRLVIAILQDLNDARNGIFTGTNYLTLKQQIETEQIPDASGGNQKPQEDTSNYLENQQEAEKAAKEQQASREKLNSARKEELQQLFDDLQSITRKNYEARALTGDQFRASVLENENAFKAKLIQLTSDGFDLQIAKEKNKTGLQAIETQRRTALDKIQSDSQKRIDDAEKIITDSEKKITEEKKKESDTRIKQTEDEIKRELDLRQSQAQTEVAKLDNKLAQKLISEKAFVVEKQGIELKLLEFEANALNKRFALVKGDSEKEKEILAERSLLFEKSKQLSLKNQKELSEQVEKDLEREKELRLQLLEIQKQIADITRESLNFRKEQERKSLENVVDSSRGKARLEALQNLKRFEIEEAQREAEQRQLDLQVEQQAAFERVKGLENEYQQREAIVQLYREKAKLSEEEFQAALKEIRDRFNPAILEASKSDTEKGFDFGLNSGNIAELEINANRVTGIFQTMGSVIGSVVGGIAQGIGSMINAWVLYGNLGGQSLRKMTAQVLASVSQQAAVLAVFELAKGFAALFFNPAEAGAHFTAAALYGSIAGVAAVAGRLVAGDSFKQETGTGANNPSTGGITNGGNGNRGDRGQPGVYSQYGDEMKTYEYGANAPANNSNVTLTVNDKTNWFSQMFLIELDHNADFRDRVKNQLAG